MTIPEERQRGSLMTNPEKRGGFGAFGKITLAATVTASTVLAVTPSASASVKCSGDELCLYRLKNLDGGLRGFSLSDKTYSNDYYDQHSPQKSVQNSAS